MAVPMESSDSDEYFDAEEGLEKDKETSAKREGSAVSPALTKKEPGSRAQRKEGSRAEEGEEEAQNGGKTGRLGGTSEGQAVGEQGGRGGESGRLSSPSGGAGGGRKEVKSAPDEEGSERERSGVRSEVERPPRHKGKGRAEVVRSKSRENEGYSMSLPTMFRRGRQARKEEEEEQAPVPPPRRKRKKRLMEKQASLDNLDQPSSAPLPRSMTVTSVDYRRESSASVESSERGSIGDLRGRAEANPPEDSQSKVPSVGVPLVGAFASKVLKKSKSASPETEGETLASVPPSRSKSHEEVATATELKPGSETENRLTTDGGPAASKPQGRFPRRPYDSPDSLHRSATPTIMFEPNVSLELTEELIGSGDSEVVTQATDAPLTKARGVYELTPEGITMYEEEESMGEEEFEGTDDGGGAEAVGATGGGEKLGSGRGGVGGAGRREQLLARASHSPTDDTKILEKTMIKNLDTGEAFPLSAAEEKIPQGWGWSPLSEHLIRRMELASGVPITIDEDDAHGNSLTRRKPHIKRKLKHFFGKRKEGRHAQEGSDEELGPPGQEKDKEQNQHSVKYKPSSHYKGPLEFEKVRLKQDLSGSHLGAVWTMEFSICGRLLATAGQDSVVRVWVMRTAYQFFHELQAKYQRLGAHSSGDSLAEKVSVTSTTSSKSSDPDDETKAPFLDHPLCSYYGHQADILDLSWSKNFFLLSSSMDKTVRLWHISRKECLCCFQHVDFVTAITFHPRDDRYFLSGSLDGKIRLWNIPDKRVALWNEIEFVGSRLITAANFCNNGKLAVAGTYDGRCIFYDTEHLKYHTQIQVRSRHGKGKGRKISGVEPLPGEDKLLVTSNDSRIRLYNLKDHSLSCKYKGGLNTSSQIKATFSRDGQYMISGSEDNYIYIWKTHHDVSKLSSARRDRNEYYESFSAHSAPVTTAVFAPVPGITVDEGLKDVGQMVVAADYQGCIKVYVNSDLL